jgi:excisionase family DNA binding protein
MTREVERQDGAALLSTRLLSLEALEERSDVSRHTWRLWLRQGKLPAVRLGRRLLVEESDYQRFVAANRK